MSGHVGLLRVAKLVHHKDDFHPYGGVARPRARGSDVFHRYGSAFARLTRVSRWVRATRAASPLAGCTWLARA